jgi:hypothetical protein
MMKRKEGRAMNEFQPYLIEPDPAENPRYPLDPSQRAEILEAGGGQSDIGALERLKPGHLPRSLCPRYVIRLRRSPAELAMVERIARQFVAALDARGRNDMASWLDLCGELKLQGAGMDHDHKRFLLWVLKQRGGPLAARLAVDGEEFRALKAAGWKEEISDE